MRTKERLVRQITADPKEIGLVTEFTEPPIKGQVTNFKWLYNPRSKQHHKIEPKIEDIFDPESLVLNAEIIIQVKALAKVKYQDRVEIQKLDYQMIVQLGSQIIFNKERIVRQVLFYLTVTKDKEILNGEKVGSYGIRGLKIDGRFDYLSALEDEANTTMGKYLKKIDSIEGMVGKKLPKEFLGLLKIE